MKYAEKFEDMEYLQEDEGILKGKNPVHCAICGELTIFIDLCSEAPFCSDECLTEFYKKYWEEENKLPHPDFC